VGVPHNPEYNNAGGGREAGVYHYTPQHHALERRLSFGNDMWCEMVEGQGFLMCLSSIHWREVWKYGERAFRYCMLDAGHAIGSIVTSAMRMGWQAHVVTDGVDANTIEKLFGIAEANKTLDSCEKERGLILLAISTGDLSSPPPSSSSPPPPSSSSPPPSSSSPPPPSSSSPSPPSSSSPPPSSSSPPSPIIVHSKKLVEIADKLEALSLWEGSPNHLSTSHTLWDVVEAVDSATRGSYLIIPKFIAPLDTKQIFSKLQALSSSATSEFVIRSRRSALDFSGSSITLNQFYHILWYLSPHLNPKVWSSLSHAPQINIFFFVYNIADLQPGLYALLRNEEISTAKNDNFLWEFVCNDFDIPLCITSSTLRLTLFFSLLPPPPLFSLPHPNELQKVFEYGDILKKLDSATTGKTSYAASCHQAIATHPNGGAFSVGMYANLEKIIGTDCLGPSGYLAAHYECGLIGHMLYLEAHALGFGATGMGCFLDDLSREAFGLQYEGEKVTYYPLYHSAIGCPDRSERYKPFDYKKDMFDGVLDECVACTLR
jgi:nitroreductase